MKYCKRAEGVTQWVQQLPSMLKTLGLIPRYAKKTNSNTTKKGMAIL
jgi:hypothetical protein